MTSSGVAATSAGSTGPTAPEAVTFGDAAPSTAAESSKRTASPKLRIRSLEVESAHLDLVRGRLRPVDVTNGGVLDVEEGDGDRATTGARRVAALVLAGAQRFEVYAVGLVFTKEIAGLSSETRATS